MKARAIFSVLLITALSSCKKKPLPAEEPASPEYTATFYVDGQPVNLAAGVENYSMSPSYFRDSTGTLVFRGDLKPADCSNCGWTMSFMFRDSRVSTGDSPVST